MSIQRARAHIRRRIGYRSRVGAVDGEYGRHSGLVMNLDEKRAPSLLDQLRLRRALLNLDAAFGIDVDTCQAVLVENPLDLLDGLGALQRLHIGCRQRLAYHLECLHDARDLRREWLKFDRRYKGKFLRGTNQ